jgi:hypothetical protein
MGGKGSRKKKVPPRSGTNNHMREIVAVGGGIEPPRSS